MADAGAGAACPVCGGTPRPWLDLPHFPVVVHPVRPEDREDLRTRFPAAADLVLDLCHGCGHAAIREPLDANRLADVYARAYHFVSPMESGLGTAWHDAFLTDAGDLLPENPDGGRVLEIGCSDGYVLAGLREHGWDVVGCDPAEGAAIAERHGIPVVREPFSAERFASDPFDVVILRHLVEHVHEPRAFLEEVRSALAPGGTALVETPSLDWMLDTGSLVFCKHLHLHHFSRASLGTTLAAAGLPAREVRNRDVLVAACDRGEAMAAPPAAPPADLAARASAAADDLERRRDAVAAEVAAARDAGRPVVVWGAGSFAAALPALFGLDPGAVDHVVDSDPRKHGRTWLHVDWRVEAPDVLDGLDRPLVVVGSQFGDEIADTLEDRHRAAAPRVLLVHPDVRVLAPAGEPRGGSRD